MNRAQRRAARRRQGKQPGAEGRHLAQVADPDRRVTHRPSICAGCCRNLDGRHLCVPSVARCATYPPSRSRSPHDRYRYALEVAFADLPAGPPPRRRNTGEWEPHQRDGWNLAVRLRDVRVDVGRFLTDTRIAFTNNDAERPLRPAKLHGKISGSFRNAEHAKAFATFRRYLGTADKHGKNLYQALVELFTAPAGLPPQAAPA